MAWLTLPLSASRTRTSEQQPGRSHSLPAGLSDTTERVMPAPSRLGAGETRSLILCQAASTTASNSRGKSSSVSIVKTASIKDRRRSGASGITCA